MAVVVSALRRVGELIQAVDEENGNTDSTVRRPHHDDCQNRFRYSSEIKEIFLTYSRFQYL